MFLCPQLHNTGTKPTLPTLVTFSCIDGRVINIPEEIATKYYQFGTLLLDDRYGSRVESITHKHHRDPENINTEILREWLNGRGKHPVTWVTLVEVLQDIKLYTLARNIEDVMCQATPVSKHQS